ncbi:MULTISPECIES: class I lanthipeptide [unclassified Flavobacterium]|uniref:class I lanthipeptide n=1 Tax=unclassified Flavobacterium TaxID=196869 RepID=UPI003608F486
MKKQNANKLAFNKAAVSELNENQLTKVNGGTYVYTLPSDLSCTFCISSSNGNWTRDEIYFNQIQ